MITHDVTNIRTPPKENNVKKCEGDYCNLINVLDSNEDLHLNLSKSPLHKSIVQNHIQSRTRAYKILQRILTKKELLELEDTGKITRLKIAKRINPNVYRCIPRSCVVTPRNQFRIEFQELQDAEDSSLSESIKSKSDTSLKRSKIDVDSTEPIIQVCDMCYHSYRLLSQYRYIIDEKVDGETKGSLKSKTVPFDELITEEKLGYIATKSPKDIPHLDCAINALKKADNHGTDIDAQSAISRDVHRSQSFMKLKSFTRSVGSDPSVRVKETEMKIFRFNHETTVAYSVLQSTNNSKTSVEYQHNSNFNMILCHDMFETLERFVIYFKQLVSRNGGHQILLWNYPGQAYTQFSEGQCLNNEFHSDCLRALLQEIGSQGSKEFITNKPFYILGHGHGASIACTFSKSIPLPNLKALVLMNPLSHIDSNVASVIHDCRNVFTCSSEERPDLPFYFYSKFIFSDSYLKKTTTPLAINLYTAVNNPITRRGRIQLCDGILKNTDVRSIASDIFPPIISMFGKDSVFIRPSHAIAFSEKRNTCCSIQNLFLENGKCSVLISMPGGHELFQERKKDVLTLIEQLLIGHYESNGVSVNSKVDPFKLSYYVTPLNQWKEIVAGKSYEKQHANNRAMKLDSSRSHRGKRKSCSEKNCIDGNSSISRNVSIQPTRETEYMSWRLKRNRKRSSRFQRAARIIQSSMRVFMAKTMFARLQRQMSALTIQRYYRGAIGRCIFIEKQKEQWAAKFVQRMYRGALGRRSSYYHRLCILAQIKISCTWRAFVDRKLVKQIVYTRELAAITIQSLWRTAKSCSIVRTMVLEQNAAITIQSLYRGHCARLLAAAERKKYIFSLSQSRGIEIGRKLLSDHRVHAAKLKSELSILDTEKISLTKKVDEISKDVMRFESRAKELQKAMHDISDLEVRQKSTIYASSKAATDIAIREKKIQLDQEFSVILSKMCDRRNQLTSVKNKLSQIQYNINEKEGKLKVLERKLVALLEAQEHELNCIKKSQEDKTDNMIKGGLEESISLPEKQQETTSEIKTAAKLFDSTEDLMKFGFSSMAMTYFTSMNMVRAIKSLSLQDNFIDQIPRLTTSVPVVKNKVQCSHSQQNDLYSSACGSTSLSSWTVDDVADWLRVLSLHQYEDSFRDGAVDGPFLSQLTDDDLLNILGIEHKLHRKKILYGISKLTDKLTHISSENIITETNATSPSKSIRASDEQKDNTVNQNTRALQKSDEKILPSLDDLFRSIRSNKQGIVKEALSYLQDGKFDPADLRVQFMEGLGTVYKKHISDLVFHINQSDEHGNTLLHVAAQNGNIKIAKLLVSKGSNPNHQNKQGQTPGHFAVSYQFYDFASWLFDEEGGGGDDLLVNIFGLGPYDGLSQSEL